FARRRDLFRRERSGSGGLQQVHSVFSVSGRAVFGGRERFAHPREGLGGHEPVERIVRGSEFGIARREIRRRRPCARGGHIVWPWRRGSRSRGGERNRRHAATLGRAIASGVACGASWEVFLVVLR